MLESDGSIIRPTYRGKGDETHIGFCIHYNDREVLYKIKRILNTSARVACYPDYESPQAQINIYDRMDLIREYGDIKSEVPPVIGYERHYIRGIVDGDGCLYKRKNRNTVSIEYMCAPKSIGDWIAGHLSHALSIEVKAPRLVANSYIYKWEGKISKLIAWYLYHGDVNGCSLRRKRLYYKDNVVRAPLHGLEELLAAVHPRGYHDMSNPIHMNVPSRSGSLTWAKRLQKVILDEFGITSVPIPVGVGTRKYYGLSIPLLDTQPP